MLMCKSLADPSAERVRDEKYLMSQPSERLMQFKWVNRHSLSLSRSLPFLPSDSHTLTLLLHTDEAFRVRMWSWELALQLSKRWIKSIWNIWLRSKVNCVTYFYILQEWFCQSSLKFWWYSAVNLTQTSVWILSVQLLRSLDMDFLSDVQSIFSI